MFPAFGRGGNGGIIVCPLVFSVCCVCHVCACTDIVAHFLEGGLGGRAQSFLNGRETLLNNSEAETQTLNKYAA